MRYSLLAGCAFGALALASAAAAQTAAVETQAAAAGQADVESVIVYAQGQARQVQTINSVELATVAPGTSALKVVQKLPGVNFQSADAFGAYEWSTRISIRGFNQNQIGFTLDGVPLGDMSYGNFNGLHISRAIASEDLGATELAQGAGSLQTASTSDLGGALKFTSRDPLDTSTVYGSGTVGSAHMYRAFVRLDTGVLPTGARAYISYANQDADKWKGDGEQKQQQIDFKAVQPIGDATLTGFFDWSRRRENDYQDMSLGMIKRLGSDWDNNSNNWAQAVQLADIGNNRGDTGSGIITNAAAGKVYPSPITTLDDTYFNAAGLRNDTLWGLTLASPKKSDIFTISGTVYGHHNKGQGIWFTPYVPSPNAGVPGATTDNAPISIRTTEYGIDRIGGLIDANLYLGKHTISFGGWYENNDFDQARRYYGLNRDAPQRDSLEFQSGPFHTDWAYAFNTKTWQGYLQDAWAVTDAFKVNFGFKAVQVKSDSTTITGSPVINGSIKSDDAFQPQVGATYKLNGNNELFAGYTENMRAFGAAHTDLSPFATTQAGFDAIKDKLKPETSRTVEAGYRFRTGGLQAVAAVYYVKFDNRLIGTTAGAGIVGSPTILANAGSVTAKGFETAVTWQLNDQVSLFGSYAYNDSKYDDDVTTPDGVLHDLADKTTVNTPKHLLKGEVAWENKGMFAKLGGSLTSRRYLTYTNDLSVPSYALFEATLGYRFPDTGWTKGVELQLNVTNLFNKQYVSTIGTNGFSYTGDAQTVLPGAPRQGFVTLRKTF